jgi:Prokaryotic E2 family C/ThiF family
MDGTGAACYSITHSNSILMALANFFDKIALHAAQLLQGMDRGKLEDILCAQRISLFFDQNAAGTTEGRATLDLSVRLLARLYPNLRIASTHDSPLTEQLTQLAMAINPAIESFPGQSPTAVLVVGKTAYEEHIPAYYIGSNQWLTQFSMHHALGSSDSANPMGAGAAACFGAANLFRQVFREQLPFGGPDEDFTLSLLDGSRDGSGNALAIEQVHLGETLVVGLGAIGNGLAWTLSRWPVLQGTLVLIDPETISLSNLQRYVLADQSHRDQSKADHLAGFFRNSGLHILQVPLSWDKYMEERHNWKIDTVLTGLDNAEDRIMVQGTLPKKIFNAWTQPANLGVSRHQNFLSDPCLCCLYYPESIRKSRSQEIADHLGLGGQEITIRTYLANHIPVDAGLLQQISAATNLPITELQPFLGKSLEIFYAEVVCGGTLLKYTGEVGQPDRQLTVPCAFESALAGILLAAELIKDKAEYPTSGQESFRFNLLRPLAPYLHSPEIKRTSCICTDPVFRETYAGKWNK